MGQRLLAITDSLLVDILKAFREGETHRYFRVDKDGLPLDAAIVATRTSPYWPNTVEITLQSPAWEEAGPRTPVTPQLSCVELEGLALDREMDEYITAAKMAAPKRHVWSGRRLCDIVKDMTAEIEELQDKAARTSAINEVLLDSIKQEAPALWARLEAAIKSAKQE